MTRNNSARILPPSSRRQKGLFNFDKTIFTGHAAHDRVLSLGENCVCSVRLGEADSEYTTAPGDYA